MIRRHNHDRDEGDRNLKGDSNSAGDSESDSEDASDSGWLSAGQLVE